MMNLLRIAFALALAAAIPAVSLAQHPHPAPPPPRPAPPAPRAAPPQPVNHAPPPHNTGGFSFPHEVNPAPVPVHPPVAPAHPPAHPLPPQRAMTRPAPLHAPYPSGPNPQQFRGRHVHNPHGWGGWGWNRGVVWYPAPYYWGGGFWGPFWIGAADIVLLGSIVDYDNEIIYPSYQIETGSPGAELLQDYGLQQTECGPPNLVVIWGPGNSVICAYPNDLVAPGNYEVDPTTLTIISSQ